MLNSYGDDRLPFSAEKKVILLGRLRKWETLSKFLRVLESDPWFNKWEAIFDINLTLSYCELGRLDEAEEVLLAGYLNRLRVEKQRICTYS